MNEEKKRIKKKDKGDNREKNSNSGKKKRMIIAIIVISVVAVISYILLDHPELFDVSSFFKKEEQNKISSMYSNRIISYDFYPSEYDVDITKDEKYMQLNRYIQYTDGAETYTITDEDYAKYGKPVEFFAEYFEIVRRGDTEAYNDLFTDHYYETNEPYYRFATQKIYDISLQKLSEENSGDKYAFNVTYKIYRNDGTFRNDIDSDGSKTLYFELVNENGVLKIDRITNYVS